VTLTPVESYDTVREDFVDWFESLETYCVVLEKHKDNGKFHLHAYLKFYDGVRCELLRWIVSSYDTGAIDIQPCRSRKWLKGRKEDDYPFYNFSSSQ
jgi:hypothetical protein